MIALQASGYLIIVLHVFLVADRSIVLRSKYVDNDCKLKIKGIDIQMQSHNLDEICG